MMQTILIMTLPLSGLYITALILVLLGNVKIELYFGISIPLAILNTIIVFQCGLTEVKTTFVMLSILLFLVTLTFEENIVLRLLLSIAINIIFAWFNSKIHIEGECGEDECLVNGWTLFMASLMISYVMIELDFLGFFVLLNSTTRYENMIQSKIINVDTTIQHLETTISKYKTILNLTNLFDVCGSDVSDIQNHEFSRQLDEEKQKYVEISDNKNMLKVKLESTDNRVKIRNLFIFIIYLVYCIIYFRKTYF